MSAEGYLYYPPGFESEDAESDHAAMICGYDKLRAEVEELKKGMEAIIKYAWQSGYEAGHNHTVEGEWGYAEERAADWFSDSMFSNLAQHMNSEDGK